MNEMLLDKDAATIEAELTEAAKGFRGIYQLPVLTVSRGLFFCAQRLHDRKVVNWVELDHCDEPVGIAYWNLS